MKTIVKISKSERDIIEKILLDCHYEVNFYTVETNEHLLQCEISTTDPAVMWHLGKMCGYESGHESCQKQIDQMKKLIL